MNSLFHFLIGTWFVSYSNFPMWTHGNKMHPTFTYTPMQDRNGTELLFDEVHYLRKGKRRSIKGYDRSDKKVHNGFVWKGKGALGFLRSRWQVLLRDETGSWAVIHFSKTLFTPAGVDILSRTPTIPPLELQKIRGLMAKDSLLKKHLGTLQLINQQ